ncbi:MAG: hypothetical protein ACRDIB_00900, partial [Ardenticatenaceae bacterium]
PIPFPYELQLYLARDSAVPVEALPAGAAEDYRLETPTAATGLEWALHVRFFFKLRRGTRGVKGVSDEDCRIAISRMHINWPVPVVTSELELLDVPEGRLWVDQRQRQVVVEKVPARITSEGQGLIRGEVSFRIGIRHPANLQGKRYFKGRARIDVEGVTLSGLRAHFFDAAGHLQQETCDGQPLVHYRTELHTDFEFWLQEPYIGLPILLERRYTWPAVETISDPFEEVDRLLRERGFALDGQPGRCYRLDGLGQRWWATRNVEGQELTLDVLIRQRERSLEIAAPSMQQNVRVAQPAHTLFDVTVKGYYRGRWEEAMEEVRWLEQRLRQQMDLRREDSEL